MAGLDPSGFTHLPPQHCRHPEVLAVLHGEPRRMATSACGDPSRRRASARLLRMTVECVRGKTRILKWTCDQIGSCKDVYIPQRLDPAIHLSWKRVLRRGMNARVKPAHDESVGVDDPLLRHRPI